MRLARWIYRLYRRTPRLYAAMVESTTIKCTTTKPVDVAIAEADQLFECGVPVTIQLRAIRSPDQVPPEYVSRSVFSAVLPPTPAGALFVARASSRLLFCPSCDGYNPWHLVHCRAPRS